MSKELKTIQQVAEVIYKNLEVNKRDNGSEYYSLKDCIEWQQDIIHAAHLDRMPSDDIYDRINTVLEVLSDLDKDATEDDVREAIYQIEPDIYSSDLTKWLNSNNNNVYYLDEAIQQGATDGFKLLASAQCAYIQEIASALISAIVEYIESI